MTDWEGRSKWTEGALERAWDERDELARQLEDARRLACHYLDLLHLAHESDGFIEPDWKTR